MVPEHPPVAGNIERGDPYPVGVSFNMLCYKVHRNLAQEEVRSYAGRRRYAGPGKDVPDDHPRERTGIRPVEGQVGCCIDKHFVNAVDMDVVSAEIAQVDSVNPRGILHVQCHAGFRRDVRKRLSRFPLDFPRLLNHLKEPAPPGKPVGLERRRHGKADRFFRAGLIGDDKVCLERIKPALNAFDGGIEGFEVYRKVGSLCHRDSIAYSGRFFSRLQAVPAEQPTNSC